MNYGMRFVTLYRRQGSRPSPWKRNAKKAKWLSGEALQIAVKRRESEVAQSCPTLCDPWTVAYQAPPSMGFSRQEYWSGLPCPPPGDLPDPGIKPASLTSPGLVGGFFTTSVTWEAHVGLY